MKARVIGDSFLVSLSDSTMSEKCLKSVWTFSGRLMCPSWCGFLATTLTSTCIETMAGFWTEWLLLTNLTEAKEVQQSDSTHLDRYL